MTNVVPPGESITERDMLNLLLQRYNTERRGALADRYVRAEHVRATQKLYGKKNRIADFIAVDKYYSSQAIIGHEVKVSRADWLTELRAPSKSEPVKQFCSQWYLVVPDAKIVQPGELPDDWGLMVKAGSTLRVKHKAPQLDPEPMTLDFVAGLTAAAQKTAHREPLYREARTIHMWNEAKREAVWVCQSCGDNAPCPLHQPKTFQQILDDVSDIEPDTV